MLPPSSQQPLPPSLSSHHNIRAGKRRNAAPATNHEATNIHSNRTRRRRQRVLLYAVLGSLSLLWMLMHVSILRLSSSSSSLFNTLYHHHHQPTTKQQQPYDPNKPLNILLLYGDDWRFDSLGIVQGSVVQTPFLDQLATTSIITTGARRDKNDLGSSSSSSSSIWFTHACVTTSVCWISRASLHTGQYYRRHESHDTDHPNWYREWNTSSFPALLRKAGWYTGHVGKWNWKYWREVIQQEYDFARQYEGYHWYAVPTTTTTTTASVNKKKNTNSKPKRIHTTKRNQRDAIEFLQTRPKDQPFLLTVAFFAPHAEDTHPLQYLPQPKSMSLYQNQSIPLPPLRPSPGGNIPHHDYDDMDRHHHHHDDSDLFPPLELPPFFNERNIGRQRWRRRFETPSQYQSMMKNYYRLITEVDAACQRIVAEVEAQGILDQTLIIFTTDNGYFHAEHGLADKWYPHQPSIRIPLIVRDPRRQRQHRQQQPQTQPQQANQEASGIHRASSSSAMTCDALVLNVDIAPTILRAANLTVPSRMQGFDLSTLYLTDSDQPPICGATTVSSSSDSNNKETPTTQSKWRQEFFYEHPKLMDDPYSIPASEALVRKDYKYVEWPDFGITQLFDLQHDPGEFHDLATDPHHATRLQEMRDRHAELKRQLK